MIRSASEIVGKVSRISALLLLAGLLMLGCASKRVILVDPQGAGDVKSLANATRQWQDGQQIVLAPGVYDERLIVRTNMVVKAAKPGETTLRYSGEGPVLSGADASGVKIIGVNFERNNAAKAPLAVLVATDIEFDQCRLEKGRGDGIEAARFGLLTLKNTTVAQNGGAGVYLHHQARAVIDNSTLEGNSVGLRSERLLESAPVNQATDSDIVIRQSTIRENGRYGLLLDKSSLARITDSHITGNGRQQLLQGEADLDYGGVFVGDHGDVQLTNNEIQENRRGVAFFGGTGRVEHNVIANNDLQGVKLRGASTPTLVDNRIHHNTSGIMLIDGAQGQILQNQIHENKNNGIEVLKNAQPTVRENWITDNTGAGVVVTDGARPSFEQNLVLKNAGYGIFVGKYSVAQLRNNTIYRNGKAGVWFTQGSTGGIVNNAIVGNARGLSLQGNSELPKPLEGNLFWQNGAPNGAPMHIEGIQELPAKNVIMDPLFRDIEKLDLSPKADSPLLMVGVGADHLVGALQAKPEPQPEPAPAPAPAAAPVEPAPAPAPAAAPVEPTPAPAPAAAPVEPTPAPAPAAAPVEPAPATAPAAAPVEPAPAPAPAAAPVEPAPAPAPAATPVEPAPAPAPAAAPVEPAPAPAPAAAPVEPAPAPAPAATPVEPAPAPAPAAAPVEPAPAPAPAAAPVEPTPAPAPAATPIEPAPAPAPAAAPVELAPAPAPAAAPVEPAPAPAPAAAPVEPAPAPAPAAAPVEPAPAPVDPAPTAA